MKVHWIDNGWNLNLAILEFARFRMPHSMKAAEAFLRDVIADWVLSEWTQAETTNDRIDIIKNMSL